MGWDFFFKLEPWHWVFVSLYVRRGPWFLTYCARSAGCLNLQQITPEYAKLAGLARHVWRIFKYVQRRGLISPDILSWEHLIIIINKGQCPANRSPAKFYIRQTFYSELSGDNSKCPVKDCMFARHSHRRGSNQFHTLWITHQHYHPFRTQQCENWFSEHLLYHHFNTMEMTL